MYLLHQREKKIHKLLPHVTYSEIAAILNNKLVGEHGGMVLNVTIAFLKKRIQKENQQIKKIESKIDSILD